MEIDELTLIGPLDLGSVDAIHRKRLLAFVNHFVVQTTHFLNRIACSCEDKLLQVELRLQRLEAALILLENKLGSIPGLTEPVTSTINLDKMCIPSSLPVEQSMEERILEPEPEEAIGLTEVPLDESLLKYVKMMRVGVPLPALKLKMEIEGITPEMQLLVLNHVK